MKAAEDAIALNKQVIVLVPEISLTPQTVSRFKGRFGDQVAILHSRLSLGERYDEWRKIRSNEVQIVVGARSAVFALWNGWASSFLMKPMRTTTKIRDHVPAIMQGTLQKRVNWMRGFGAGQRYTCPGRLS